MSSKTPFKWSLYEAVKVFIMGMYNDIYGDLYIRRKLIKNINITQKKMTIGEDIITYMLSEDEYNKSPHIPVIFLHGSPGSAMCWHKILKEPGKYIVVAIDRPGFGPMKTKSSGFKKDLKIMKEVLKAVYKEHGKVIIVGHSLGAGLATKLTIDNKYMVRGLMFIGGSLDPDLEKKFFIQNIFAFPPFSWLLMRSIRSSNKELIQYSDFLKEIKDELSIVECPVAVMHSKDDNLVPYENVYYAGNNFTNAEAFNIISLESGGHFINYSHPDVIKRALKKHVVWE
jgi:pimeloyl-ACP methyl ester carboxylesterase